MERERLLRYLPKLCPDVQRMEIHTQVRLMWVSLEPRKSILGVKVGVASERGQLLTYPLEARECFFKY